MASQQAGGPGDSSGSPAAASTVLSREPAEDVETGGGVGGEDAMAPTMLPERAPFEDTIDGRGTKSVPAGILTRGDLLGRYVVLSKLGAGGMGIVYVAYDPELDRKVALKVLRPGPGSDGGSLESTRLLREAQALAKLTHPNVVTVHDVGSQGGQVWLAMEFVEGMTLREWAKQKRRGWREVLSVMVASGRGLEAAHGAELLHRDFKPDNVMLAGDGRVLVMDFGLARAARPEPEPIELSELDADTDLGADMNALLSPLTRAGSLMGTPGYIAAEQFRGETATAAVDQFSYCVSLWELLFGRRPFSGDTLITVASAVLADKVSEPPKARRIPRWLEAACRRGLRSDPSARWPSMSTLLAELESGHARARRRKLAASAAVVAVAVGAIFGFRSFDRARRVEACRAEAASIAEVWNPDTEAAVRQRLEASGVSYASSTVDKVVPRLEAWTEQWRATSEESCIAFRVEDTSDPTLGDRSEDCLEDGRTRLEELTTRLSKSVDEQGVAGAARAAAGLPPMGVCADEHHLSGLPAFNPQDRAKARDIEAMLSEARSLRLAGNDDAAIAIVEEAIEDAEGRGLAVVRARARVRLAVLLIGREELERAELELRNAYLEGVALDAPAVAADAAMAMMWIFEPRDESSAARSWAIASEAMVKKVEPTEGAMTARLLGARARLEHGTGNSAEAVGLYERALALSERIEGTEHPSHAALLFGLGNATAGVGDTERSIAAFERAAETQEAILGPENPQLGSTLNNNSTVLLGVGRHAEAEASARRALKIFEDAYGKDLPQTGYALFNLGKAVKAQGRNGDAIVLLERAVKVFEAGDPPAPANPLAQFMLAQALWDAAPEAGQDRVRARKLAVTAREGMAESRFHDPKTVDDWLTGLPESSEEQPAYP